LAEHDLLPLEDVGVAVALELVGKAPALEELAMPLDVGVPDADADADVGSGPDPDPDDGEEAREPELVTKSDALPQKVMTRLTLSSWHATCT